MMKSLTRVPTPPSYKARYDAIVSAKKAATVKARLQAIDASVAARYMEFEAAVNAFILQAIAEDAALKGNSECLLSCYGNKTKKTVEIFDAIRSSQQYRYLERCPYCGITLPKTYDHYLPKEKFPEFSVHPLNLVPCCSDCNSSKGAKWLSSGDRCFIHYYSDPLPEERYLFVAITAAPAGEGFAASFSIDRPATCTVDDWRLIESHYNELGLLERFSEQANSEIASAFDAAVSFVQAGGPTDVGPFIQSLCGREEAVFGVNHWRTVLKRELSTLTVFKNRAAARALALA